MDFDVNSRNYDNYVDIDGKPVKRVVGVDSSGNLVNPATSAKQLPDNHNVTVSNMIPAVETGLAKETTVITNATTQSEEAVLLRRIVKLLESNAVVDIANRQKVTLDAMTNGNLNGIGITLSGPFPNAPTIGSPTTSAGTTYWQPVWTGPVDQRFQIIDQARLVYNQSIRSHLSFT